MKFKQPRVSTRTREALLKRQKIKEYLKDEPYGAPPMVISLYTGINHNTVKTLLPEMANEGELKRLEHPRGYYVLVENDRHSIFSWNFHNLILTFDFDDFELPEEKIIDFNPKNDIVNYRFEAYQSTKKATFRLETDYPQPILAIIPIIWLFQKIILFKCGIEPPLEKIKIATVEFNQDYIKIRKEDNAFTYTELMEQIKVYNKEHCMRKEIKATESFTAGSLFALLYGGTIALQNHSSNSAVVEALNRVDEQLKVGNKTTKELLKLLQKENKMKINDKDYL